MAVAYADLVAFGFAYVEDNALAHVKLKSSALQRLNSGDNCVCSQEDFVILAEFSEVKGPVVLSTIPSHVQSDTSLDLNNFIMKIMSVDYQANPGGCFCIYQDTQVLQTDISSGRHAYVHYFTLNDIYARGFVRPLCLAYVSSDSRKLHRIFPQLREHFLKTTDLMKVDNRQWFAYELSKVLKTTQNIKNTDLDSEKQEEINSTEDSIRKDHLIHQLNEYSEMLNVVEASLTDTDYAKAVLDHWKSALTEKNDDDDDDPSPVQVEHYMKICDRNMNIACHVQLNESGLILDKKLRPISALNPWGTASALWRLTDAIRVFGPCDLSPSLGRFPPFSDYEFSKSWDVEYVDEAGLDTDSAWDALSKQEFLELLVSFATGAREASTTPEEAQLVDQGNRHKDTSAASGTEESSSYHSLSNSNEEDSVTEDKKTTLKTTYQGTLSLLNSIEKSADSYHTVNYSQGSSLLESYQTINDTVSSTSSQAGTVVDDKRSFYSVEDALVTESSINNEIIEPILLPNEENVLNSAVVPNIIDFESETDSDDSESFHDILEAVHSDDNWSIGSVEQEFPLGVSWSHCLWKRHRPLSKSGHRLLKFFWTYRSAAQHIIYSLLTGRTLVLAGDDEAERRVSRIISALSPLVPPIDSHGLRVLRWHRGILVSAHVSSYQIIGLCVPERLSIHEMISPKDKNCATILDVRSEQLYGPAYRGYLLSDLGSNVRDFPSDHSVLLFVYSVLVGVGRKLKAYKALMAASSTELPGHACRLLDLHGCDADMIRYLSKVTL